MQFIIKYNYFIIILVSRAVGWGGGCATTDTKLFIKSAISKKNMKTQLDRWFYFKFIYREYII